MFAKVDILRNIEMDGCPSVYRTFLNHLPCDSKIITLHFTDKKDIFQVAKKSQTILRDSSHLWEHSVGSCQFRSQKKLP